MNVERNRGLLLASAAMGLVMACASAAQAQSAGTPGPVAEAPAAGSSTSARDEEVIITGANAVAQIDRLPRPIEDIPQSIRVIDTKTLKEQNVVSLDQAVRNIPGITANTGEGGGATAGDQFRIRGFDAQNDISNDGLRDFGSYTRDSFNVESVQVFLGPSGQTFGRGSFGGAINTSSKTPRLDDFAAAQGTVGTDDYYRGTFDINQRIGASNTAWRLNLMGHSQSLADIDVAESKRWGGAASIGIGLDTPNSFTLSYFHQGDDRVPYFGVPVVVPTGQTIARPLPVDRSSFYGTEQDRDETTADVLTARGKFQLTENIRLSNDTRVGFFDREFMAVAPGCDATCITNFFDGNPLTVPMVSRGGANGPYYLDQWGAQNVTTAIGDYQIGGLKSQTVAGLDLTFESATRLNTNSHNLGTLRPTTPALAPTPTWQNPVFSPTVERETESTNFGAFFSEQLWLTDEFSILGGLRWDRYAVNMDSTTFGTVASNVYTALPVPTVESLELEEDLFSPRLSFIYEPAANKFFYASYAKSAQPATGSGSATVGTPVTANLTALEPTTSETYEIGARVGVLDDRITLGAAIFQTERDNAKEIDQVTGGIVASGDEQRVRGIELNVEGRITDWWDVSASYTFLDTETLYATANCSLTAPPGLVCPGAVVVAVPNPAAIGKPIPFAAEHSATIWSTFTPTRKLTLGVGARYTDETWLNNTNLAQLPSYFTVEAMAAYQINNRVSLQLNGYNLTDREDNFDQAVAGRAAHSQGRAFTLMLNTNF